MEKWGGIQMISRVSKFLAALVLLLGFVYSTPVRAQVVGATLSGTITDPQGGVVPNAKVSVKNEATGITTDTTTNSAGLYSIVNLPPADYDVSVSASGFSTATSKVTLTVGAKQALNLALTVGEVSQTVEVTGAAPTVQTTNATISGNVQGAQIVQLPLNGRDWVSLATLTPGVVSVRPHEEVTQPGGSQRGLGIQLVINGARPQQNVYRLNGVIVNDYSNAGPGNVLGSNAGVDAIQEFSVLTTNYSAEYGDTSGGVINAITKSGTNTLHGSAYEFMRNDVLDAANRFEDPDPVNPVTGLGKGHFERNQFGASAGWKVLRDRAFLFGNYEGLRQTQALSQQGKVLTADARLGVLNDVSGAPLPPLVGACPYAALDPNGMTNEAPGRAAVCVDNFIFAQLNPCTGVTPCPSGYPVGGLAPLPNGAVISPANNDDAYYNSDNSQITSDNYSTVRGDLRISDNDSLVGSWYRDTSTWQRPGVYSAPALSYSGYQVPHGAYTLEETHIFSTTVVNTFRVGLNQSSLYSPAISDQNPLAHATTLCVVPPAGGACVNQQIGLLAGWVAGGGSVGGNGNSGNSTRLSGAGGGFTGAGGFSDRGGNKIEIFDDLSKTVGRHQLKFGFMLVDNHDDWVNGPAGKGGGGPSYAGLSQSTYFPTFCDPGSKITATNCQNDGTNPAQNCVTANVPNPLPLSCGGGVAAYLLNIPHTVRMPIEPPFAPPASVHHWRDTIYAGYVQDDWQMSSSLTVNLGLRYEMSTIPYVTDNNINNLVTLDQNLLNAASPGACVADLNGQGLCSGFYHTTFQQNPTNANFEPRLGFAWDPFHDGKTSIRGGVGIFDVLPQLWMFSLNSMQTAPSAAETDLSYKQTKGCTSAGSLNGTICPPAGWGHFGFVLPGTTNMSEVGDATNPALVSNSGAARRWGFNQPNPKRSYVLQYNLNIQRQITPTLTIMVAYAGSRSWHDPYQTDDLNTVVPYHVAGNRWIFPSSSNSGLTAGGAPCNPSTDLGCTALAPVSAGCSPGPPDCSQTDAFLGLPVAFISPGISANQGITPGLLINSNAAQFQSSIFAVQSWYNAFQVRVDKSMGHGLLAGGAFSWGKSFDTSSSSFASDNYSNNPSAITPWWDLSIDRGLSDFNVTKNLSINFLYTVPTPASWSGPAEWIAGGWGIGANFEASDGIPLWPLITNETVGMLNGGPYDIPDLAPGCNQALTSTARTGSLQYLNPACYILPVAPNAAFFAGSGSASVPSFAGYNPGCDTLSPTISGLSTLTCPNLLGNLPRNSVIGPGLINLDFSVTKDNHIRRISETANLQFRAEIFNIANHPNYAFPVAGDLSPIGSDGSAIGGFGQLTKTQSPERQIQFALKFIF
jgi:Carboxypeptidase regulatory-like domain